MLSFFSRLFASSASTERDLSFGLLQARGIPPLVQAGHWDQIEAIASTLSGDELSRLLDGLCLTDRYGAQIKKLIGSAAEFAHLVLGAWYLYGAWQARTSKWGKDLTKGEVDGFAHYLQLAHEQLSAVFATEAYRCEARARLVRVEMGFSDPDAGVAAYEESIALDDSKFWAYHHMFKLASPKWLGDKDELVAYIQSVAEPRACYALWMMYLVEMYSDAETESESTAQRQWYAEHAALIRQLLVQPELPVDDSLVSIYANNYLAYVYHLLGERSKRDDLLLRLGTRFTPYPWAYFGIESNSDAAMQRFRRSAVPARP